MLGYNFFIFVLYSNLIGVTFAMHVKYMLGNDEYWKIADFFQYCSENRYVDIALTYFVSSGLLCTMSNLEELWPIR